MGVARPNSNLKGVNTMTFDPSTITFLGALASVLCAVKPWAELALKVESENKADVRTAAGKLMTALDQTERYIRAEDSLNLERHVLVSAWHDAAISLHGLNPELSDLCYLKGEHWKSPESWSQAEIESAGFALEQIKASVHNLLKTPQTKHRLSANRSKHSQK